mgnify:CR=1 FL=1
MTVLSEKFTKDIDESVKAVTDNRPLARPLKINTAAQEGKKDFTSDFSSFINEAVESVVNDKSIVSQPAINEELTDFQPVVSVTPSNVMSLIKKGTPTLQSFMENLTKEESSETLRMLKQEQVEDSVKPIDVPIDVSIEESLKKVVLSDKSIESFIEKLALKESSGNYQAEYKDSKGRRFVGLLNIGQRRLNDYNKEYDTNITLDKLKANNALQDKFNIWHIKNIDKKYDERDRNMGRDSFRAVAHLGGKTGALKYFKTGGKYDEPDELGTKLSKYDRDFRREM